MPQSGIGRWGALAAVASPFVGELTTEHVNNALVRKIEEQSRTIPHVSDRRSQELLDRVRSEYDVDVGTMHSPYLVGTGAAYLHPAGIERVAQKFEGADLHPRAREAIQRRLDQIIDRKGQHGIILTGRHFKKPGTMEHELGHAIAMHRGNPVERFIGDHGLGSGTPSFPTRVLPHIVAIATGILKGPLAGASAGAASGILAQSPRLYSEYSADKYGDRLLDRSAPYQRSFLPRLTYLTNAALPAMISGGLSGILRR